MKVAARRSRPTVEAVRTLLRTCLDPELSIDIVSLGLIYDISVRGSDIHITMTLTTPGCPLKPYFDRTIRDLLRGSFPAATVTIDLTFEPPWDPTMMSVDSRRLFRS